MNRIPVSASYSNCLHNFIIAGIPEGHCKDAILHSFTCIIKNILQRDTCVPASNYLKESLGALPADLPSFALIDRTGRVPNWNKTIKGSAEGDNPAAHFFYYTWPELLPEYDWVRQLIIPEAKIFDILDVKHKKWLDQSVDFYLAQANLIIEVDGSQHTIDPVQASLDKERDRVLTAAGNYVVRIPVGAIKNKSDELHIKINDIREHLIACKDLQTIYAQLENETIVLQKKYETVMRFQFAILELLQTGILSFDQVDWNFSVEDSIKDLFQIALTDLVFWYRNLYILKGELFCSPNISFDITKEIIRIESDLYSRSDDHEHIGVFIYTDYWDAKDYYKVSCSNIVNYSVDLAIQPEKKESLEFLLRNIFGYSFFQPGQLQIITNLLNLKRTIGILPTGGGKSLCYQLSSILQPAVSISVCPLVSLLIDQKDELDKLHLSRTAFIAKIQKSAEKDRTAEEFGRGKYQIVWVSPERLQNEGFRFKLQELNHNYTVAYAVIDEVHCLSEWGHDFRTSYLTLVQTIERVCPNSVLVGLTATASQAVLSDLKIELCVDNTGIKALPSLQRENLTMHVIKTKDKTNALDKLLYNKEMVNSQTTGIVFTVRRDTTNDSNSRPNGLLLLQHLQETFPKLKSAKFHAGMNDESKRTIQSRFKNDDINLLSATKAFGMGINKDNIRYTIHYGLPWSVEAFYQEAGRAGRGAKKEPADCYILYTPVEERISKDAEIIFHQNSAAEEISSFQNRNRYALNDLGDLFYLWSKNNKGITSDLECISDIIKKINNSKKIFDASGLKYCFIDVENASNKMSDKNESDGSELALYRLKILGIVYDWTINWNANVVKVYLCKEYNEQIVIDSFYTYIRRHSPGFGLSQDSEFLKYKDIFENKEVVFVRRYAEALINWTYDNIIYTRRRMIQNIKQYCDDYTDAVTFRKRIDDFLKISEKSVQLDGIVENFSSWDMWFEVFYDSTNRDGTLYVTKLTIDGYKELREATARYLESYKNIIGLNIVYVLAGALCGRYNFDLDTDLMMLSMDDMNRNYPEEFSDFLERFIGFTHEHKTLIEVAVLEKLVANILSFDRNLAARMYDLFEDDYSLAIIVEDFNTDINKALEEICCEN